jgi:glycogen debranching enzyme
MKRLLFLLLLIPSLSVSAQQDLVPRFEKETSGLVLDRHSQAGSYFGVVGRKSGVFGFEHAGFEVWTYPVKLLRDFELFFRMEDYPLQIAGSDILAHIEVRPEATVFTYRHPAFTVRQTIYAPVDQPGILMLLDVDSVRPMEVTGSFTQDLSLMWPAGLGTGDLSWSQDEALYRITEATGRFAGAIEVPGARDISVMPYQEEPREVPTQFVIRVEPEIARNFLYPVAMAGSVTGFDEARRTARSMLEQAEPLYQANARYYRDFLGRTIRINTPDARLDEAFAWAKIGTEKGLVTNPHLGTGFVAGYRTAGASERPGYAWYFGRDGLWTTLAIMAYGDYAAARVAMDFLGDYQREDGMIPHEISQSAGLIDWFEDYGYPWHSADATPLFVIAQAEYFRQTGDMEYLTASWDRIRKAHAFTASTDAEDNHLVDNFGVGHGWVEDRRFQIHEEFYLQGLWVEANRGLAEMAKALGHLDLAERALATSERTRQAMEDAYWMPEEGRYRWVTDHPGEPEAAKPYWTASTSLTAVPMWWGTLFDERAQQELDYLGGGALATDWGTRLFSQDARDYDPLSYHAGSVWPLFSGWASMAAYRYGRPSVGIQALMSSALLTRQDALGYVTELLSGALNASFGRSSHHQIWSEAMVVTPLVRGTLGLEITDGGQTLRFAPQLPADWGTVSASRIEVGGAQLAVDYSRIRETVRIAAARVSGSGGPDRLLLEPAMPLDAKVSGVTVDGHVAPFSIQLRGDRQFVMIDVPFDQSTEVLITRSRGSDAYAHITAPAPGARNRGLRILRSRAEEGQLHVVVEGLPGERYLFAIRTPHKVGQPVDTVVSQRGESDALVSLAFRGSPGRYVRRELRFPLVSR